MSANFRIRALRTQNLDDILAIAAGSIGAPQWSRSVYAEILSANPAALVVRSGLVACSNGTLAGFAVASLSRVENLAELETIVVEPSFRHRGIGSGLLAALMEFMGRGGASMMRLEVRESNAAALSLYLVHGFRHLGRRRSYYTAPDEDALILEAPLSLDAASPPTPTGVGNSD